MLSPARLAYYRVFRPRTFGVKVVLHDASSGEVLVVRHSYGNRRIWHVPGGGYRPGRESAEDAARREMREELSIDPGPLVPLGEYRTSAQGNRDTARIFAASVHAPAVSPSPEILEYRWAPVAVVTRELPIYGVTRHALALFAAADDPAVGAGKPQ